MILNLFSKKNAFFFESEQWKFDETNKNYYLKLDLSKTKITPRTKIYLYKQQDEQYIFMSEGFEQLVGCELVYCAQFPFSGKIRIK